MFFLYSNDVVFRLNGRIFVQVKSNSFKCYAKSFKWESFRSSVDAKM